MNGNPRTAAFKQKVAIEALKGDRTINEIAKDCIATIFWYTNLINFFSYTLHLTTLYSKIHQFGILITPKQSSRALFLLS